LHFQLVGRPEDLLDVRHAEHLGLAVAGREGGHDGLFVERPELAEAREDFGELLEIAHLDGARDGNALGVTVAIGAVVDALVSAGAVGRSWSSESAWPSACGAPGYPGES